MSEPTEEELEQLEHELNMEFGLIKESPYWKANSERRARRRARVIGKDED